MTIIGKQENNRVILAVLGFVRCLWSRYPGIFCCPVAFYTGSRYDGEVYAVMVARVPEHKDKWEMRVFDLWYDEAFNTISPEERALFMNAPIHPTKAGYRQWWCSGMERQLLQEK